MLGSGEWDGLLFLPCWVLWGPHLFHRPQGAHRSSSSRGSRRSEAWQGLAQGFGGRQSCRWSCGVGRGSSEGPLTDWPQWVHQFSWAQARLSPDMLSETHLPSLSTHLLGWSGPKPYRSHVSPRVDKVTPVCLQKSSPPGWQLGVTAKATSPPCSVVMSGTPRLGRKPRLWLA